MEFQSSFSIIAFFLSCLLLLLARNYRQNVKAKSEDTELPPGPRKLPVIGNLHQLAAAASLPHRALRELANKYGPLLHLQLGEISAVVVSSSEMAMEIMKTHDLNFAHRPEILCSKILSYGSTDIAFAPYGEYWRQMRKICTLELLSAKRVNSFSSIREDEVTKLIESIRMSAGTPYNLSARVYSLVNFFLTRAAFGKRTEDEDILLPLLQRSTELAGGFDLADVFPSLKLIHLITRMEAKLESIHKKLDKTLQKILNEHREKMMKGEEGKGESGEDLVDVLLRVQQSGDLKIPVEDDNIKSVILDMFGAGTDTSATTIMWAMSQMMKNPRVREKAQAEVRKVFKGKKTIHQTDLEELTYLKLVIKETLRLHPPAPLLLPRECRETSTIAGYKIPVKTKVIINGWALGRDPKYWSDAESFIPERFHDAAFDFKGNNYEYNYLPFGAGRRMCPGVSFAAASMELPLACLLYFFNWELPKGMKPEDLDMTENFGATVGRKNDLYLIPTPYDP